MKKEELITVPKGTLIHIGGMPFWLKEDTEVLGRLVNYKYVLSQLETPCFSPVQANGDESFDCFLLRKLAMTEKDNLAMTDGVDAMTEGV